MNTQANSIKSEPFGHLSAAGSLTKKRTETMDFRVFGHYAWVYVRSGSGQYEDAKGHRQTIRAGDLIIVFPDLSHRYGPTPTANASEPWRESYLVGDGPVFELWEQAGLLRQDQPVWPLRPVNAWKQRFETILQGPLPRLAPDPTEPPNRLLQEVCRLQQFLADARPPDVAPKRSRFEQQWIDRACQALEQHGSAPAAADALAMSTPHFRRLFTRSVGTPPAKYLAHKQIERACMLMQQTDWRNQRIAVETGFCDEYHFSRRFKQITGQTPRAYRKMLP